MKYENKIKAYYQPQMSLNWTDRNFSKSPSKPKLFMLKCLINDLSENIEIDGSFKPFNKIDFYKAHTKEYVDAFFLGKSPICQSNGLKWSKQLAKSIKYTNASLYNAIKGSIDDSSNIYLSPTSGFHHASPERGCGYCTFSGQVIAALKIYKKFKVSGSFIDLDGHFGNSIEDSREFCPELNKAVPNAFNINPAGKHKEYLKNLSNSLIILEKALLEEKIHYVVYCHGADSHEDDELGNQLNTEEWFLCTKMVTEMILRVTEKLQKRIPFTYCLFGGYRSDDYDVVLNLHYDDLEYCFELLTK